MPNFERCPKCSKVHGINATNCDGFRTELRWVNCEECGGTGEIVRSEPASHAYAEAVEYTELCSACDGTGRDCVTVSPVECDDEQQE